MKLADLHFRLGFFFLFSFVSSPLTSLAPSQLRGAVYVHLRSHTAFFRASLSAELFCRIRSLSVALLRILQYVHECL